MRYRVPHKKKIKVNKTGIHSYIKIVFIISAGITKAAEVNSSTNVPRYTNVPTSRKPDLQCKSNIVFSEDLLYILSLARQLPVGHGLLILEVSRSHTTTRHSL